MVEIALNDIKKNYGFKNVLDGFSLEVNSNDRIAIVGKNGAGKTTLFKIITKEEQLDSGIISIRKGSRIGFLQQIPPKYNSSMIVNDILMTAFSNLQEIQKEMNKLEKEMAKENGNIQKTINRYGKLQDIFMSQGGYDIEHNLSKICMAFNITDEMRNQKFESLSGGQRTMVHFAKLLLEQPEILLLDEPTNHLDIKTIEWLEDFLKRYKGTVVINSHDRYFLDKVVNKIALLENGKCSLYHGNYSYFVKEQERELMAEFQDYKTQQKQIQAMKDAIKRYKDWGNRSSNEKFFKAAANLEKRLERMELIDKPEMQKKILPLNFQQNGRSGKRVISVKDVSMMFGDNIVLEDANLEINYGEKVCLIGTNGSGKTTLIKIILGELEPTLGIVELGSNVKIGYLSQHIKFDDENITVLEEFRKKFNGSETQLRATLAKFFFNGENVFKQINKLSGGEKVRLILAELIQKDINFLILDEPTNHIDIDTRETLEAALTDFKGTILFVSHDRYFINKLAERIVELENGKTVSYVGNYDYYIEKKSKELIKEESITSKGKKR